MTNDSGCEMLKIGGMDRLQLDAGIQGSLHCGYASGRDDSAWEMAKLALGQRAIQMRVAAVYDELLPGGVGGLCG